MQWRVFRPVTLPSAAVARRGQRSKQDRAPVTFKQPIESTTETTVKRSPRTKMLRASKRCNAQNDTRRRNPMSMNVVDPNLSKAEAKLVASASSRLSSCTRTARCRLYHRLSVSTSSRPHLAAEIGSKHFHSSAHFVKPRPHPRPDPVPKRILSHGHALPSR